MHYQWKQTFSKNEWAKIQCVQVETGKSFQIRVIKRQMAGKGKLILDSSQPDIVNFIQRSSSVKRSLSSPTENPPNKKSNMEVTTEVNVETSIQDKLAHLPPKLKLLYDTLNVRLESIENKIDPTIPAKIDDVETKQIRTDARLTKIEMETDELKQRLVNIEDKLLESSIVVNGISEDKYEEPEPRRAKLNKELACILSGNTDEEKLESAEALQIISTERVGKYNPKKGRPMAVKFVKKSDAEMVLDLKKKLRKGIYVDQFYCVETEKQRKRLRPILSAARRLEEFRGRCKMEGTEVVIRGKHYSFDNLWELPESLSLDKVSSRQDASHYGFFGEFNPLSNFHPATFTCNGEKYCHTEQFIQARKAEFCNDMDCYHMIMATSSASKCKELGRQVKNCDTNTWNKRAKELCFPGILCKFQQNPGLGAFLKNTGDKTLLECCFDNVWGNGHPMSDPDCLNPQVYTKQGIQGEMLEEIREILRTPSPTTQESFLSGNSYAISSETSNTTANT